MIEAEWLASEDPEPLLKYLFGPATVCNDRGVESAVYLEKRASDRKLRLFAVACCFRIWQLITDEWCRRAVVVGEQYAEGEAEAWEFEYVREEAEFVLSDAHSYRGAANQAAYWPVGRPVTDAALHAARFAEEAAWGWYEFNPRAAQAALIRDIFGNPFRPVDFAPEWRTDTAVILAKRMYDSREFSAMPILADALQDAGCDSDDVLTHCRGDGPHVRGCWVVDLVLGKV